MPRNHGRRPGVAGVVALVLAGPVLALAGLAWLLTMSWSSDRDRLAEVDRAMEDLKLVTEIQGGLSEERVWTTVQHRLASMGVWPEMINAAFGVDVAARRESSTLHVDELRAVLRNPDVDEAILAWRDGVGDPMETDRQRALDDVFDRVTLRHTTTVVGGLATDDERTVVLGDTARAAATARATLPALLVDVLLAEAFGIDDPDKTTRLAVLNDRYESAMIELRASADQLHIPELTELVDDEISIALGRYVADFAAHGATPAIPEVAALVETHQRSLASEQTHADALDGVLGELGDEVERRRQMFDGRTVALVSLAIGAIALAATGSLVATFYIVRPLRRVAVVGNALRQGDTSAPSQPSGPREVHDVGAVMSDLANHLHLAEQQATALADGRLDAPELGSHVEGDLGSSLQAAVGRLRGAIEDAHRNGEELRIAAHTDPLTQLANRRSAFAELDRRLGERSHSTAVVVLDLDGFKEINDRRGHQVGDAVIVELGKHLRSSLPSTSFVARMGGDEFIALFDVDDEPTACDIADDIVDSLNLFLAVDEVTLRVSASAGLAIASGDDPAEDVMRHADYALYRAKASGGSRCVLADAALKSQHDEQGRLVEDLREAIRSDELRLAFQPIVEASTGRVIMHECLARWTRRGVPCPPATFIEAARNFGLMIELDRWVLRRAIEVLAERQAASLSPTGLTVNIAAHHIFNGGVAQLLQSAAIQHGADLTDLVIEITEEDIVDDLDVALNELDAVRSLGVRIALDDFGSGYASIGQLRRLPIDLLKIDRSLIEPVDSPRDLELLRAVLEIADLLGMETIVEGVETEAQAAASARLGANYAQGYLFGLPADTPLNCDAPAVSERSLIVLPDAEAV